MRTYLKNWNVVKGTTNPNQLIVISDWTLEAKMVKLIRVENVYENGVVIESSVTYEVVAGTPNPTSISAAIMLPVPWYQLPYGHKTYIRSFENSVAKDEEYNDTIRASII